MVKQSIQIYLRLRPPLSKLTHIKYGVDSLLSNKQRITIETIKDAKDGLVCNRKELHQFKFDSVLDINSEQDHVFNVVAKPVLEKVLLGYNSTIFAYGQTGSGKTYTITGGAKKYCQRGIVPRCLTHIFESFENNTDTEYTMKISYLEIYNEIGYDLLGASYDATTKLENLPRVSIYEHSDEGTTHLKNLSFHKATNVDEAMNLLFMGDTNRIIAETPMNEASTRSHCIFTLHITAKQNSSDVIRYSKLHLVDLAGSERVYKCGLNGVILNEAKFINLSLHYLEQVIISLAEKQRTHIPYRNSLMTMVLRDSLGGNSLTSMIATCSLELNNVQETISTCRFAQRVALIKNNVIINEQEDPQFLVNRLKLEIEHLKSEIKLLTGLENDTQLTIEDKQKCEIVIKEFVNSETTDQELINLPSTILSNIRMICFAFSCIKTIYWDKVIKLQDHIKSLEDQISQTVTTNVIVPPLPIATKDIEQLRNLLEQRDHEIQILVTLLKREKMGFNRPTRIDDNHELCGAGETVTNQTNDNENTTRSEQIVNHVTDWLEQQAKGTVLGNMSIGRAEAFDVFKRDYVLSHEIEAQKTELKSCYTNAKLKGKQMQSVREEAANLQDQINRLMQQNFDPNQSISNAENSDLVRLKRLLNEKRAFYRTTYQALKELKQRVDYLQHSIEVGKLRMTQDFDAWWRKCYATTTHGDNADTDGHSVHGANVLATVDSDKKNKFRSRADANENFDEDKDCQHAINTNTFILHDKEEVQEIPCANNSTNDSDFNYVRMKDLRSTTKSGALNSYNDSHSLERNDTESPPVPTPNQRKMQQQIPLTGDPVVDADILTFIRAREKIQSRRLNPTSVKLTTTN